jgi:hypothetical protein
MEIKIRDLSASRELWKTKALEAQREKEKLQQELVVCQAKNCEIEGK